MSVLKGGSPEMIGEGADQAYTYLARRKCALTCVSLTDSLIAPLMIDADFLLSAEMRCDDGATPYVPCGTYRQQRRQ